jgi:uncharacterized protein
MHKIAITGATGFIGSRLSRRFSEEGYSITVFTRNASKAAKKFPSEYRIVEWDYNTPEEWEAELNKNDIVIHLAGANLFGRRWDDDYKKKILESREISSKNLVKAIRKDSTSIKLIISASGIDYYGETNDMGVTEDNPPGNDFLAEVCRRWEAPIHKAAEKGIRYVIMRTAPVLSTYSGYLKEIIKPFRMFIGGPLGTKESWVSWVHIDDLEEAYLYVINNENINDAVNLSSPNPVTNKQFAKILGEVINRPSFFAVPEFALKLVVGEAGGYIAQSHKVIPAELKKSGFKFRFPELQPALIDLIDEEK